MENENKYLKYTLQDFLEDDDFVKWASDNEQDAKAVAFWNTFPSSYPAVSDHFNFAVQVIRNYRVQEFQGNKDNKARLLERITNTIQEQDSRPAKLRWLRPWMKVAAMFILVALAGYLVTGLFAGRNIEIATGYGEKRTITLPDNSVVTLNASSVLHYSKRWNTGAPREVWVDGEAFFDVQHLNKDTTHIRQNERFIVHSNGVTVEVLGTSFNIRSRHGKTNIGLITGKIKVGYKEADTKAPQSVLMLPGDYIEYADNKLLLTKKIDKPEKIKRWTQMQLTFTDATVAEIIETLEDNYGYAINVKEASIKRLKIEGDINVTNVDELLTVITTTLNIKIDHPSEKELVFSSGK